MDRGGAWWAAIYRVTKSQARLSTCIPHTLRLHCIQVIFFNFCVHHHCTFYLDLEIHKLINQLNELTSQSLDFIIYEMAVVILQGLED